MADDKRKDQEQGGNQGGQDKRRDRKPGSGGTMEPPDSGRTRRPDEQEQPE